MTKRFEGEGRRTAPLSHLHRSRRGRYVGTWTGRLLRMNQLCRCRQNIKISPQSSAVVVEEDATHLDGLVGVKHLRASSLWEYISKVTVGRRLSLLPTRLQLY